MKSTLMIGIGASVILVSSSMAVYFKSQANDYRLRWIEASIEAESRTPAARNRERDVAATDRSGHVTQAVTERYEQRVASLQRQISDLEVQLGQRETVWVSYPQEQTGQVEPRGRPEGEPPQRDWNDWMQNLQETDPERYQQLQERRERAQQRMQSNFAQRAAFLLDRDTSGLSESEVA